MGKRLIIAEKPSVAKDIAHVLSVPRTKSCFESEQWIVSSALGHLFELTFPPELAACKDKWNLRDLPLLPARFDLLPLSHSRQQLNLLLAGVGKRRTIKPRREQRRVLSFHLSLRAASSGGSVSSKRCQRGDRDDPLFRFEAALRAGHRQCVGDVLRYRRLFAIINVYPCPIIVI